MMKEYFTEYIENLSHSLKQIDSIKKFTNNSAIIGFYSEKLVIDFIKRAIDPLKVCTGGIVSYTNYGDDKLPQIDVILYDSNPLPPIFNVEDFGLVNQESVFGILEIKRTDYSDGLKSLKSLSAESWDILPSFRNKNKELRQAQFLGIICLVEHHDINGDNELTKLLKENKCTYLIVRDKKKDEFKINHDGILKLINFLVDAKRLHKEIGNDKELTPYVLK